jgi:hypothetical protein
VVDPQWRSSTVNNIAIDFCQQGLHRFVVRAEFYAEKKIPVRVGLRVDV